MNKAISSLKAAIAEVALTPPGKDEPYYTEIPVFDPEKVLAEIDNLQRTYASIFDAAFWETVNAGTNNGNNNQGDDPNNGNNGNNGNNENNGSNDNRGNGGRGR